MTKILLGSRSGNSMVVERLVQNISSRMLYIFQ